jgi:nucleoside-diphosphate-sugar epimerase
MLAATRNIAEAASRLGLRQVVHVSSMAVYGPATGLVQENATLLGGRGYADAKLACEAALNGDAIILRPGIVYGPGGEHWVGRIGRLLRAGRLGDLGPAGDGRCNLIHSRDIGAAVVAALQRPLLNGGAFNLSTPAPPRWNRVFLAFGCAIGAVPVRKICAWQLCAEGRIVAPLLQIGRMGGWSGRLPAPISPALLALFGQDMTLDYRLADQALGFARSADADGLAECAAWFLRAYGSTIR